MREQSVRIKAQIVAQVEAAEKQIRWNQPLIGKLLVPWDLSQVMTKEIVDRRLYWKKRRGQKSTSVNDLACGDWRKFSSLARASTRSFRIRQKRLNPRTGEVGGGGPYKRKLRNNFFQNTLMTAAAACRCCSDNSPRVFLKSTFLLPAVEERMKQFLPLAESVNKDLAPQLNWAPPTYNRLVARRGPVELGC